MCLGECRNMKECVWDIREMLKGRMGEGELLGG